MTEIERLARAAGVEASAWKVRNDGWGVSTWHYMGALPNWAKEHEPLYSAPAVAAIVAQARREALEGAARTCEQRKRLEYALRNLMRGYVITLENGRDRILFLGGECDSLEYMERTDPYLAAARAALGARP